MAKICQITGKGVITGNNVSHSHAKTKRTFRPNLFRKKYFLADESRWIHLMVSTSGMKIIQKKGLSKALQEAKAKGYITKY
ncbi:MAG: 50S ribosomal protein L28 [Bacteroidota bacterium]|nr:50S ribosomal protein L28 [Bacteroidota bacterium]